MFVSVCRQDRGCWGGNKMSYESKHRSHWLGSSKECLSRRTGYEEHERMAKRIKAWFERTMLRETVAWMWLCLFLSRELVIHTATPLNYCPRSLETKWIMPSWLNKNWAAWMGSHWAVRTGTYGGTRPAPVCQLRLFMRHSRHCGTWSSCPSSNDAEGNIIYIFMLPVILRWEFGCSWFWLWGCSNRSKCRTSSQVLEKSPPKTAYAVGKHWQTHLHTPT